jgi:hypothetical protein
MTDNNDISTASLFEELASTVRWNGHPITADFLASLTDANFHALRADFEPIINKHLKDYPQSKK